MLGQMFPKMCLFSLSYEKVQPFKDCFYFFWALCPETPILSSQLQDLLWEGYSECVSHGYPHASFFVVKHKPGIQRYRARMMAKNMLYTHRNLWPACITRFPLMLLKKISSASLQHLFKVSGSNSCVHCYHCKKTQEHCSLPWHCMACLRKWYLRRYHDLQKKNSRNPVGTLISHFHSSWNRVGGRSL